MKIRRRALIVVLCVLLVFSFSAVVYASASKIYFIEKHGSHKCIGRGSIGEYSASTSFKAEPIEGMPILPDEAYSSKVTVYVFDSTGKDIVASSWRKGTTTAVTTCNFSGKPKAIGSSFEFSGESLGNYVLYNS